ncbi:hypothetical protein SLEP1_g47928 [Rubroshorea leprosula]|uniref:Uncharacterized protein n=1 Tax=Rubroshorea leprosula TaxID=152421 RepID=A0AAV5LS84_9ROSI|nr:hypothetical protein SLEP1_g47928 [Rubroshorea leprosula]
MAPFEYYLIPGIPSCPYQRVPNSSPAQSVVDGQVCCILISLCIIPSSPPSTPRELISTVWVEIVCYAAINCKPIVHARQGKQADGDNFSLSFGY